MRKTLLTAWFWFPLGLLSAVVFSGSARADTLATTYEINFSGYSNNSLLPTGLFTFDSTSNTFSNFIVSFGNISVDFTAAANTAPTILSCSGSAFDIMNGSTACRTQQVWLFGYSGPAYPSWFFYAGSDLSAQYPGILIGIDTASLQPTAGGSGFFSVSPVPEPAEITLLIASLTVLALLSRRTPRRPTSDRSIASTM